MVIPPPDVTMIIHKLAKYVAKNGKVRYFCD